MLNGGFGVNIITKRLRLRLGLPKPKPTTYNLRMANLVGLIKDFKIYVPYIITCIVLQNSVVDFCYSMLLRRPWLRDVKVAHD